MPLATAASDAPTEGRGPSDTHVSPLSGPFQGQNALVAILMVRLRNSSTRLKDQAVRHTLSAKWCEFEGSSRVEGRGGGAEQGERRTLLQDELRQAAD